LLSLYYHLRSCLRSFIERFMRQIIRIFLSIVLVAVFLITLLPVHRPAQAQNLNYLHTDGNLILDSQGKPVLVTGISWFGLETENYASHGLWARSLPSLLDQIVELGFNTIRLPYSNQLFDPASVPNGINYDLNPDLIGLNGLEIMDKIIAGAGERGLKVILDRHRPDSHAQSELWYTSQYSEERWINDWVMLAKRYGGDDTVIGADLHNEPHGIAGWGTDDPATDWRLAAERAGNAILDVNPNLLIIVQGVEQYRGEFYWWGGNLMGVREQPVRLNRPNQLVYSPHTYGPGVYPQVWFSDPTFPENMPGIWDQHWGYVQKEGLAPLILGEFGGRSVANDKEGVWQRALVSYLRENRISYLYWTLNPNSGDTGGILLDDWQSVDPQKKELLSSYQFPLIGNGSRNEVPVATASPASVLPTVEVSSPVPATAVASAASMSASPSPAANLSSTGAAAPAATAIPLQAGGLSVRYHTSSPAELSKDAKPEFIIANRSPAPVRLEDLELVYWFTDDPGHTYAFYCDWAQIGCEKISGEFESLPDGLFALHIHFRPGSGELLPGQESGEIKLRFNRADWSEFRQSDDYSFSTANDYVDWEKGALYLRNQLVWGSAPGPTLAATAPATNSAIPPATNAPVSTTAVLLQPAATTSAAPSEIPGNSAWSMVALAIAAFCTASVLIGAVWLYRKNR
jgi:endoglucanase